MGYGPYRLLRNLLCSIVVAGVVIGIGIGLPALNKGFPAARAITTSRPYQIAAGVTVVPPPGAGLDVTKTRPGPDEGAALFLIGSVRYAIVVTQSRGTLDEAAARLRAKIEATHGYQVAGGERPTATTQGVPGWQGTYASTGRYGRYAAFLHDGIDVEVTVAGSDVELRRVLASIETSILTLTFAGPS